MTRTRTTDDSKDTKDTLVDKPTHGIAAGVGAVLLGGATGAAAGTLAGPVGTVIGAAVGAVAGALGGDAVASAVDEVREQAHWRETFQSRPYVEVDARFEDYAPAYAYGVTWYRLNPGRVFDDSEGDLATGWVAARGDSSLDWNDAKPAAREAWYRVEQV
jgi:uncharacterized protein YcfJ